jgi:transposase-like protein
LDVVECAFPLVQGKAQRGGIAVAIPTSWNAAMRRWKRAIRHVAQFTRREIPQSNEKFK